MKHRKLFIELLIFAPYRYDEYNDIIVDDFEVFDNEEDLEEAKENLKAKPEYDDYAVKRIYVPVEKEEVIVYLDSDESSLKEVYRKEDISADAKMFKVFKL